MGNLEAKQIWLDGLSVLTAIWLIVVSWGAQELIPDGTFQDEIKTLISVAGTSLSLIVVSMAIISWRREWRGTTDRHRELADDAARLGDRYSEIFQAAELDQSKLKRADTDRRNFETEQHKPLGAMPTWCIREGFQHVGQKHLDQNVRCNSCNRRWSELQALPWWRIFFGKCKNCGFAK